MKTYLVVFSLLAIAFAVFMEIIVVMGGGQIDDIERERLKYLQGGGGFGVLAKIFYFGADHRPAIGFVGALGLVTAIVIN